MAPGKSKVVAGGMGVILTSIIGGYENLSSPTFSLVFLAVIVSVYGMYLPFYSNMAKEGIENRRKLHSVETTGNPLVARNPRGGSAWKNMNAIEEKKLQE